MFEFFTTYKILPGHKSLEYRLKTRLTRLRKRIVYLRTERKSMIPMPLIKRLKAWRLGFTSISYSLYDLDNNNPRHYLADFSDINFKMDNPGTASVNDKLNFFHNMKLLGLPSPRVLAFMDRGAILFSSGDDTYADLPGLIAALLKEHKKVVLRPAFSGAGLGVFFLEFRSQGCFMNGAGIELSGLCRFLKNYRYYLVTEFVQQAGCCAKIYSETTNTARVLTLWDHHSQKPFIAAASLRIGSRRSFPIDNFHGGTGGGCAKIDMTSGALGPCASLSQSGRVDRHDRHPETGEQVQGVVIPHWKELKKMVLTAATHFAGAPYVGWDIIITDEGCSFIEGNSPPGTAVWQVHTPLLLDERLRRFFEQQNML